MCVCVHIHICIHIHTWNFFLFPICIRKGKTVDVAGQREVPAWRKSSLQGYCYQEFGFGLGLPTQILLPIPLRVSRAGPCCCLVFPFCAFYNLTSTLQNHIIFWIIYYFPLHFQSPGHRRPKDSFHPIQTPIIKADITLVHSLYPWQQGGTSRRECWIRENF